MKKFFIVFSFLLSLFGCERPTNITNVDDGIPPAVPSGLSVYFAGDGEVILDWLNNSEPDFKGYNIYRSTDSSVFNFIYFTSDNIFYNDTLSYDTIYYYRITAIDVWGTESAASSTVSAQPLNKNKPHMPRFIGINARNWEDNRSVYLSWQANYDSDIKHYNIYRGTDNNFISDSSSFVGSSIEPEFTDTTNLSLYTMYYYKIRALDKGELLSDESSVVNDQIVGIPEVVLPLDKTESHGFTDFIIKAINVPATYEIIVQDNQFFGTFWDKQFDSNVTNDTISINFNPTYLTNNQTYYWRVAVYTSSSSEPNSISKLYQFTIK